MAKRIKHISELPKWFQLTKYNDSRKLSLYEWYIQLSIRKFCQTVPFNDHTIEPIKAMRVKPLIQLTDHDVYPCWLNAGGGIHINPYKKEETKPGIKSLAMSDFFEIQRKILPERRNFKPQMYQNVIDTIKSAPTETNWSDLSWLESTEMMTDGGWLHDSVYHSSNPSAKTDAIARINLNYTDEILIEHFKKWLEEIRIERETQFDAKHFKKNDFNTWIQYSVLPYLDLKIWERENDASIPNRVMADAIYQFCEGGEETVRKTTAPLARYLLTNSALNQLAGQITLENPEQK